MKRLLAILLLSVYLLSTTELGQFMKLPVLVEHFIEHKTQNEQLSLWQFMCMHYVNDTDKDGDKDDDMKLPFKNHDNCTSSSITAFVPLGDAGSVTEPESFVPESFGSYTPQFVSSSYLSSIWQPPKSC